MAFQVRILDENTERTLPKKDCLKSMKIGYLLCCSNVLSGAAGANAGQAMVKKCHPLFMEGSNRLAFAYMGAAAGGYFFQWQLMEWDAKLMIIMKIWN